MKWTIYEKEKKKMSFAKRHNAASSNRFTFQQIEDPKYVKCRDLFNEGFTSPKKPFRVWGCYINKGGRYGDSAALICEGFNVNLPSHMLADIESIMNSQEDIDAINAGTVGAYVYEYVNRNGGSSYSISWVDLDPADASLDQLPF